MRYSKSQGISERNGVCPLNTLYFKYFQHPTGQLFHMLVFLSGNAPLLLYSLHLLTPPIRFEASSPVLLLTSCHTRLSVVVTVQVERDIVREM